MVSGAKDYSQLATIIDINIDAQTTDLNVSLDGETITVTQPTTKTHNVFTFKENLAENGTRIIKEGAQGGSGTLTIHTVPSNTKLYITSAYLQVESSTANLVRSKFIVDGNDMLHMGNAGDDFASVTTYNPTIPLVVAAGDTIQLSNNANGVVAFGGFIGYEVAA